MAGIQALARPLRLPHRRGCLPCDRRALPRPADRQLRLQRHRGVQLPSGEDRHHRRRRHGADQRSRLSPGGWRGWRPTASPVRPPRCRRPADGPWYYEQVELGFNYRMTDIQAALGLSQLERLDGYVARRHELAARYDKLLADLPVVDALAAPRFVCGPSSLYRAPAARGDRGDAARGVRAHEGRRHPRQPALYSRCIGSRISRATASIRRTFRNPSATTPKR